MEQRLFGRGRELRPDLFSDPVSPDRSGKVIRIQAKRRYGFRIELPRRL